MGAAVMLACVLVLGSCHRQEPVAGSAGTIHWPDDSAAIIIPITVNGHGMEAVVDSGYTGTLTIPADAARRLDIGGLDTPARPTTDVAGNIQDDRALPALTLGIGATHLVTFQATATAEDWPRLGGGWLNACHAVIDYPHHLVAWPPTESPGALAGYTAERLSARGYRRIPCRSGKGLLLARVAIAAETLTVFIDTGSADTLLDEGLARRLGLPDDRLERKTIRLSQRSRIHAARCGPQRLAWDAMTISCDDLLAIDLGSFNALTARQGLPRIDGIIGADVLMRYGAILNYHDLTLHLREP